MDADGQGRWVRAIDDFLAQSETDLAFGTGDVIQLVRFADENWAVGRLNGKQGIFPICFTEPTQQPTPPIQKEDQPPQPPPRASSNGTHEKENRFTKQFSKFRSKSPENSSKPRKKLSTVWKEPDLKRLSTDLAGVELRSPSPTKSKVRPKSYAEPSYLVADETKRRSYQEATEGQWEKTIIERIVTQHESSNKGGLSRATPGRKSLKDIFRSSMKLDTKPVEKVELDPKEQSYLVEKIAKAEKEIKKLEERYAKAETAEERERTKKMIKMDETTLTRLRKELQKYTDVKGHTRMASAPILVQPDSRQDQGDEVQLVNAIGELRDTERTFNHDVRFMLEQLAPAVPTKTAELLFTGLEELDKFSLQLYEELDKIANMTNRTEQCMNLYKLFLDQLMTLRDVYAPYCARQSQVAATMKDEALEELEVIIANARRDGKTQAFNLNSLLIKPVQRVTKYPLLLEQIMKAAPQDCRLPMSDAVKEMKSTLLDINNQKRQYEIVDRYTSSRHSYHGIPGLESEESNPMKKIKKKIDRIMNPMPRDEHDPIEVEYKIMQSSEKKVKSFIEEVRALIPVVRSFCPDTKLAHEFDLFTMKNVLSPLTELLALFVTPHRLVQKWRDKYADWLRHHPSQPELSAQQVFSALNAQLMAELPKLCSLSEALLLSSTASLSTLIYKLMEKIQMQRPQTAHTLEDARDRFRQGNDDIWKTIQLFQCLLVESQSYQQSRGAKGVPVLNVVTQNAAERAYVLGAYSPAELAEVKQKWVSGVNDDCWVQPGDIVARLDHVPGVAKDRTKVLVDNGRKKGTVPGHILSPVVSHEHRSSSSSSNSNKQSEASSSQMTRNLIEFEQEVLGMAGDTTAAESDSFSESELVEGDKRKTDLIRLDDEEIDAAIAQYDFKGRSDGELTITENETLTVLARADMDGNTEWFKVKNKLGLVGYVPSSYLSTASMT